MQPIVRRRQIVPRVVRDRRPLRSDSSLHPLRPSHALRPLRSSQTLRPRRPRSSGWPRSPGGKHSPLGRTHIRCIPNIASSQRNIPSPTKQHTIRQRIVHRRRISSPKRHPHGPCHTLRPHRSRQSLRPYRPCQPLRPRLPSNSLLPLRPGRPIRPHRPRQSLHSRNSLRPLHSRRSSRPLRRQHSPLRRIQRRRIPSVTPRHRCITSPLPKHHIPQRIIRHRRVSPLVHQTRRSRSTCRPSNSRRPDRPHSPRRSRQPHRPSRPGSPSRPGRPHPRSRDQTPTRRTQPRCISMIPRNQRNIASPLIRHHIIQRIIHRRRITPLVVPNRSRPPATRTARSPLRQHAPLRRTHPRRIPMITRPQRNIARPQISDHIPRPIVCSRPISPLKIQPRPPRNPLRPSRPRSSRSPSRPRRTSSPGQPNRPRRPARSQRHIQHRRMPRQVILFTIELHRRRPRRQRQPIIRSRSTNPPLHQSRHIHRYISSRLAHRSHLHRAPQRWQRSKRHAVLPPSPTHRLHAHQPRRIHPIAIKPQHCPRHLPPRRPHRQRRKVELQQRRIPRAHIQIRDRPAIHPWQRAVHMSVRHQRSLHRKRWQSRAPQHRGSRTKQKNLPYQAHQTPKEEMPFATQPRAPTSQPAIQRSNLYTARCRWPYTDQAIK
jgi:hypothetical protein